MSPLLGVSTSARPFARSHLAAAGDDDSPFEQSSVDGDWLQGAACDDGAAGDQVC